MCIVYRMYIICHILYIKGMIYIYIYVIRSWFLGTDLVVLTLVLGPFRVSKEILWSTPYNLILLLICWNMARHQPFYGGTIGYFEKGNSTMWFLGLSQNGGLWPPTVMSHSIVDGSVLRCQTNPKLQLSKCGKRLFLQTMEKGWNLFFIPGHPWLQWFFPSEVRKTRQGPQNAVAEAVLYPQQPLGKLVGPRHGLFFHLAIAKLTHRTWLTS